MWSLNFELEKLMHNTGELWYQKKEMYLRMFPRMFIAGSIAPSDYTKKLLFVSLINFIHNLPSLHNIRVL